MLAPQLSRTPDTEPEAFMRWLMTPVTEEGGGFAFATDMGNGMWAGIHALAFHWTLKIGVIGDKVTYEDRWCYADGARAFQGLVEWAHRDWEGEPKGWRRHPATARRRNDDGDLASQWHAS